MCSAEELPPRPAIPLTFWMLVASVACVRLALRAACEPPTWVVAAVGGAAIVLLLVAPQRRAALLGAAVAATVAASLLVASLELAGQGLLAAELGSSPVSTWSFTLQGEMSLGASGWRGRAVAAKGGADRGCVWLVSPDELPTGSTVTCVGRYTPNPANDWGASSRMQGLAGTVRVVRVLEATAASGPMGALLTLREAVLRSFDAGGSEARAVLAGSVCGSSRYIEELGLEDDFAACGVSHIIAVSGGHLVVVAAVVEALLGKTHLRPAFRSALTLAASSAFVAFCGAPVSAVRSLAMLGVSSVAQAAGRRGHPLSSVSVVALAMALLDPGATGQLGYLLSVVCVCGIALFGGYARYLLRVVGAGLRPRLIRIPRFGRRLASTLDDAEEALTLTLVSQVVTLPLTLPVFGRLSLVAPLANVVLAPLFSAVLALGLLAAVLVWAPPIQAVVLVVCDVAGAVFVAALKALAGIPFASVALTVGETPALLALVVASAVLLFAWPRLRRRAVLTAVGAACALALAWVVRWRFFAPACVRVLDVGQGDAILVTDGASALLVDTGPGSDVVDALSRNHVYHLDAVLITHLHDDHVGGLADLASVVDVEKVLVAEGVSLDAGGIPVEPVSYGDLLRVGGFELAVVSPTEAVDGSENEHSVELALGYSEGGRELTGLLTGDGENEVTAAAVTRGDVGDVDFLKVGHHGSAASIEPATARSLDPEVAVASAGEGNSYGHPTDECLEALEEAGSVFLCTKDAGDVSIAPGREGPVVSMQYTEVD